MQIRMVPVMKNILNQFQPENILTRLLAVIIVVILTLNAEIKVSKT